MNRRRALAFIGSGAAIGCSGCLSLVSEEANPVNFILTNKTEEIQQVMVLIHDDHGNVVLDKSYEIEALTLEDSTWVQEEGFTKATTEDTFEITVTLPDGRTEDHIFRVTCNGRGEIYDEFVAEIREIRDDDELYMRFEQTICSDGLL